MGANHSKGYVNVDCDRSLSGSELAQMSGSRIRQPIINTIMKQSYQSNEHMIIDIDDQSVVDIVVHEEKTIWHKILSKKRANFLLRKAQSTQGLIIGVILVLIYCVGLYTFDTGLYGWAPIIYSCLILPFAVPGSVLYFGTLNVQICVSILKNFTFWFKMYNVFVSNVMSVIWAWDNLPFNVINKEFWFTIYGLYFFVNIVATSMGCLLDGFNWSRGLKIGGPLLLSLYFFHSAFYWHYQNNDDTTIKLHLFGYKKDYLLSYLATSADFNAAVFLFFQFVSAARYSDRASILSATVTIKWN